MHMLNSNTSLNAMLELQISEDGKSDWRPNEDGNVKRVSPSKPLEAVSAMISLIAKVN